MICEKCGTPYCTEPNNHVPCHKCGRSLNEHGGDEHGFIAEWQVNGSAGDLGCPLSFRQERDNFRAMMADPPERT